jgi:hypothetical protein
VKPRLLDWFGLSLVFASLYVAHALYFDWSDADLHGVFAAVCVLIAIRWQKLGTCLIACLLGIVALSWAFPSSDAPEWTRGVRPGDHISNAQLALGQPTYRFANLTEARGLRIGYSVPSPLRYRHSGSVVVYIRDHRAFWVFHENGIVQATFIGGS